MISVSNIDLIGSGEILYFVIISIIWLSFDMDMVHLRDQSLKPDISPLSPNGVRCASIRSWTSSSGAMVCATCPAACACASRASATRRRRFGVQNSCEPLELYSNYQVKVRITRLLPSWFEWVWVNQKARNWDPWLDSGWRCQGEDTWQIRVIQNELMRIRKFGTETRRQETPLPWHCSMLSFPSMDSMDI